MSVSWKEADKKKKKKLSHLPRGSKNMNHNMMFKQTSAI